MSARGRGREPILLFPRLGTDASRAPTDRRFVRRMGPGKGPGKGPGYPGGRSEDEIGPEFENQSGHSPNDCGQESGH
jgi:hypothetical protein